MMGTRIPKNLGANLTFWGGIWGVFVLVMYTPINETLLKIRFLKMYVIKNFKFGLKSPFLKKFWYITHYFEEQVNGK